MCHDLKAIADRSKVMYYDQKRLKFGLFVIFHDLSPITRGEKDVGYGLEGLKIGKKVICNDLKPIADRSEVICYDFEPITDRVEVTSHHFEAVANRSERMAKTFVILPVRLVDIEKAMGKLRTKRLLVDQFKSCMVKPESLTEA